MTDAKERDEDRYWNAVETALERLDEKASKAATLRAEIDKAPADRRAFFFHTDPFDVALLLAGIERADARPHWDAEIRRRAKKV